MVYIILIVVKFAQMERDVLWRRIREADSLVILWIDSSGVNLTGAFGCTISLGTIA